MTWMRVDDAIYDHPKFDEVSLAAVGLWTFAGAYCARHLTDGRVSHRAVTRMGGTPELAQELVTAGLWTETEGGYEFHDWLDHQYAREEVLGQRESRRAATRERVRRHRERKNSEQDDAPETPSTPPPSNGDGNAHVTPVTPTPVTPPQALPSPTLSTKELLSTADAADECEIGETSQKPTPGTRNTHKTGQTGLDALFEQFWTAWPGRKAQKLRAFSQFTEEVLAGTDPITIIQGTCRLAADPNLPEQQMIPLPAKWLRDRGWDDEPYPPRAAAPPPQPATPTPPRFDRAVHGNPAAAPPPSNLRALAGIA